MVWGGITTAGKTALDTVRVYLTARRYIDEVQQPFVIPSFQNQGFAFIHDNVPAHRAAITTKCLLASNIPVLNYWPAYSLDLNPTEYLWDFLDRRVRGRQNKPHTLSQLEQALH